MHGRILPRAPAGGRLGGLALLAALAACLDPNGGPREPEVTTTTGTTTDGWGTFPEILTSTFHPDSDGGDSVPDTCGNGKIDPGELCDQGEANSNTGACTLACQWNVCGDGYLLEGKEACDDGPKNGIYGHCGKYCKGLTIRCGDSRVQAEYGEECDDPDDPRFGCLLDCTVATSCLEIRESWGDRAKTGLHVIYREGTWLTVWCDMEADGGGYTFLKYVSGTYDPDKPEDPFTPLPLTAAEAELRCAHWGLRLFAPRSPQHLQAAVAAANIKKFGPINKDVEFPPTSLIYSDVSGYLKIMGVYPVTPGQSCVGKPLNSVYCPEWGIRPDPSRPGEVLPWYISDNPVVGQPTTQNCDGCSMYYHWNPDPPELITYDADKLNGHGHRSAHFLCELGDKHGPPH